MSSKKANPEGTEEAEAYYRQHRPAKLPVRAGLSAWQPYLKGMIEDQLSLDDVHQWMTKHHANRGLSLPAKTTVRDWLAKVRKELGKPLRRRTDRKTSTPAAPPLSETKTPQAFPQTASVQATGPVEQQEPDSVSSESPPGKKSRVRIKVAELKPDAFKPQAPPSPDESHIHGRRSG